MLKLKNRILNALKNQKGFTLVELIIVIAIIVVLAAVLFPQYSRYVERSRQSNDLQVATNIMRAATVVVADPKNEIPPDESFSIQWTTKEGSPRLIVWHLDGQHSNGTDLDNLVRDEIANIMGFGVLSINASGEPKYDTYGESEVSKLQSLYFTLDVETGEITINQVAGSDNAWNDSDLWVTEIGLDP